MDYEDFIENYPLELQLVDALDRLNSFSTVDAETVDHLVSCSSNEKISSLSLQIHPKQRSSSLNIQQL